MPRAATILAFAVCACASLSSCGEIQSSAQAQPPGVVIRASDGWLIERARSRWASIAQGEWAAAYEYLVPEQKRAVSLSKFRSNKEHHKYVNPEVHEVLRQDGNLGLLRASVGWVPPPACTLGLREDRDFGVDWPQEIELFETWRFTDGDWLYMRAQRAEDFFQEHPELLRAPAEKVGEAAPAPGK